MEEKIMVRHGLVSVSVLKKFHTTLIGFSFCLGLAFGCIFNANMSPWFIFGLLTLITVSYYIYVSPLIHKATRELFIIMTLRDMAIDQVGRSNEAVARALLSKMTEGTKPWMKWITELHPGDCGVLAEVAKKMIAEQTGLRRWRDENLSDLLVALEKRSQENP